MKTPILLATAAAAVALGAAVLDKPLKDGGGTVLDTTRGKAELVANTVAGGARETEYQADPYQLGLKVTTKELKALYRFIQEDARTAPYRKILREKYESTAMDPALAECKAHVEGFWWVVSELINEQQLPREKINLIAGFHAYFFGTSEQEGAQITPKFTFDLKALKDFAHDPASLTYARFNGEKFTLNSGNNSITFTVDFSVDPTKRTE